MLTYNTWFQAVFNTIAAASTATFNQATGMVFTYTDPTWNAELPNMIDYGEQRLYRAGKLEGDRAKQVGEEMKGGLRKALKLAEPYATQQINDAIVKALKDKDNKGPISGEKLLKEK